MTNYIKLNQWKYLQKKFYRFFKH